MTILITYKKDKNDLSIDIMGKYKLVFHPGTCTELKENTLYGYFYIDYISTKRVYTDKLVGMMLLYIFDNSTKKLPDTKFGYYKELYVHIVCDDIIPGVGDPYMALWEYNNEIRVAEDDDEVFLKGTAHHNKKIIATYSTLSELSQVPKIDDEFLGKLLWEFKENIYINTYLEIPEKFNETIDQLIQK